MERFDQLLAHDAVPDIVGVVAVGRERRLILPDRPSYPSAVFDSALARHEVDVVVDSVAPFGRIECAARIDDRDSPGFSPIVDDPSKIREIRLRVVGERLHSRLFLVYPVGRSKFGQASGVSPCADEDQVRDFAICHLRILYGFVQKVVERFGRHAVDQEARAAGSVFERLREHLAGLTEKTAGRRAAHPFGIRVADIHGRRIHLLSHVSPDGGKSFLGGFLKRLHFLAVAFDLSIVVPSERPKVLV